MTMSAESAGEVIAKHTDRLVFSGEFATPLVSGVAIDLVWEGSSKDTGFCAPSRFGGECSCEPFGAI